MRAIIVAGAVAVLGGLGVWVCEAASGGPPATRAAGPSTAPANVPTTLPSTAPTGLNPTAPLSPEESLAHLHVKSGYTIELVAAEPLVASPVAFEWSGDGRLWVVEMADYPYGSDGKMKPAGRVRVLTDTDGDGRYDTSTVFADGLNFPNGILPWRDGVIVTAAPDILFLRDTDGDGKADVREVLYTGFTEGNPQLRVCSPTYGIDNWVYVANGLSSKGTVRSVKTGKEVNVAGRDLRIRPDTGEIETETGQSQFGRRADDFGDWFGVHNSYPVRHFAIPERYAKRNPHATLPNGLVDCTPANPKVFPISQVLKRYGAAFFAQSGVYTSACSVTPVRGDALFESSFDGLRHVVTCEPVHNLVQHLVLTPTGSTFTAARASDEEAGEFLASDDPWFRPVHTAVGPDGALWVADMYRFMIEHPDWLPPEGKADYAPFYRLGADKGRIYRITKAGSKPLPPAKAATVFAKWANNSAAATAAGPADLVAALGSESGWARDRAQAKLVQQNDPSTVGPVVDLLGQSRNPLVRAQALWTLAGLGKLTAQHVEQALSDASPVVRRYALRLAEPGAKENPTLLTAALRLADDPDPRVRTQLAFSLGEWDGEAAGAALAKLATSPAAAEDAYLSAAVLTAAERHAKSLADALLAPDAAPPPALLADLIAMSLASGDRDLTARLLAPVTDPSPAAPPTLRLVTLGRFLDSAARQQTSPQKLAATKVDALAARLGKLPGAFAAARAAAADANRPADERLAAVALLGREPASLEVDAVLLNTLMSSDQSPAVRAPAVRALARDGRPATAQRLLAAWPLQDPARGGGDVRNAIADALLAREPSALALLDQVKSGKIAATDVDAARRQRLLRHGSAKVREQAAAAFGDVGPAGRAKVVEAYRDVAALAGDAVRGQRVFAQTCAACHKLGDVGTEVGPNLRSVAGWSTDLLVTAVFDPSRSAEPRYLAYTVTTTAGEVAYGLIARETPGGLTVKGLDGAEKTFARAQVKSVEPTNRSLMPDGLEAQVDKQAMADLIAFLRTP